MIKLPHPFKVVKSQRGVALLLAMFAMMLLTYIALEVGYETSVDYVVASQQVNRIKAFYAAKAGTEISLLRIMLYKQALTTFGDQLGPNKSMLDPIWQFPFVWPPTMMNDKLTEADKSMMKGVVDEALMKDQYNATIIAESARIDVNDLGSPIKEIRNGIRNQMIRIFQSELEHNEEFYKKHRDTNFEEIINNIADYVDEDSESLNGGDESAPYRDIEDNEIQMPPNRALRTLDELHQVAGMTDEIYAFLLPRVTIFGAKGVNINYSEKEMLMALDPTMTEEVVLKVLERRNNPKLGGPFTSEKEFFEFLTPFNVNVKAIEESKVPLRFDTELNFRIVSTGLAGNVRREITAVTYDFVNISKTFGEMLSKQDQLAQGGGNQNNNQNSGNNQNNQNNQNNSGNSNNSQKPKTEVPKGRPNVVYWHET